MENRIRRMKKSELVVELCRIISLREDCTIDISQPGLVPLGKRDNGKVLFGRTANRLKASVSDNGEPELRYVCRSQYGDATWKCSNLTNKEIISLIAKAESEI